MIQIEEDEEKSLPDVLTFGLDEKSRTIYLVGEINDQRVYHFMIGLSHLDSTDGDIRIVISSVGGDEEYGYAIYDSMRNARNTLIAEGYGIVASMAAAIFQGADIRRISSNCSYLIHNGSISGSPEEIQQDQVVKMAEQIQMNNTKYYQILFDNSNLDWSEIESFCKEEKVFTAKEVVEHGLADEVMKPTKKPTRKKRKKKK